MMKINIFAYFSSLAAPNNKLKDKHKPAYIDYMTNHYAICCLSNTITASKTKIFFSS